MRRSLGLSALFSAILLTQPYLQADDVSDGIPQTIQLANADTDWRLQIQLNHSDRIYKIGDSLSVSVASEKRCYVHIINVDADGDMRVLWPVEGQTDNVVEAGKDALFPDPQLKPNFRFEACPPAGKELIICFATTTPLNLQLPEHAKMFHEFLEATQSVADKPLARLRGFVTKVEQDSAAWTATALEVFTRDGELPQDGQLSQNTGN